MTLSNSEYLRGYADGKANLPPSTLSKKYMRGYQDGRQKYMEEQRERRQYQYPGANR